MIKKTFSFLCLLSIMLCVSCGGSKGNGQAGTESSESEIQAETEAKQSKKIEALVIHCEKEMYAAYAIPARTYMREYKITLHMDGVAEIYFAPTKYLGNNEELCNNDDETNVQGSWAMRSKKRGANFVEYYDIEYTKDYDDHNWCVDKDCKTLYLGWHAFSTNDRASALDVVKVDTIYAE